MAAGYYVVRSGPRRAIWTSRIECHCECPDGAALRDISDLTVRGLVSPNRGGRRSPPIFCRQELFPAGGRETTVLQIRLEPGRLPCLNSLN